MIGEKAVDGDWKRGEDGKAEMVSPVTTENEQWDWVGRGRRREQRPSGLSGYDV